MPLLSPFKKKSSTPEQTETEGPKPQSIAEAIRLKKKPSESEQAPDITAFLDEIENDPFLDLMDEPADIEPEAPQMDLSSRIRERLKTRRGF